MAEVKRKCIWIDALDYPDDDRRHGDERWSMTIKGRVIRWRIQRPKERRVGSQSCSRVLKVVRLVNTHAIFVNRQRADDKVGSKPYQKQGFLQANHLELGHEASRRTLTFASNPNHILPFSRYLINCSTRDS